MGCLVAANKCIENGERSIIAPTQCQVLAVLRHTERFSQIWTNICRNAQGKGNSCQAAQLLLQPINAQKMGEPKRGKDEQKHVFCFQQPGEAMRWDFLSKKEECIKKCVCPVSCFVCFRTILVQPFFYAFASQKLNSSFQSSDIPFWNCFTIFSLLVVTFFCGVGLWAHLQLQLHEDSSLRRVS